MQELWADFTATTSFKSKRAIAEDEDGDFLDEARNVFIHLGLKIETTTNDKNTLVQLQAFSGPGKELSKIYRF